MKKQIIISILLGTIIFLSGCSNNNQELELLKEQNKLLKEQISGFVNIPSNSGNIINTGVEQKTEQTTENTIPKVQVTKKVINTKLDISQTSPKQEAINNAKKDKEKCYTNSKRAVTEASKRCTQERCSQASANNLKKFLEECDTEYEKDLRIINLEY